ncbi:MAG: UDP-3-O-acyl-N-acetylglucosamine deacetylase [Acidaminococcales bacterium]|nr:UDP-3-O-acyl-N-acetylglucosamine deacetylase [Acidaminococcales bacterium]
MAANRQKQNTIAASFSYKGIGLHSGKPVLIAFKPLPPGRGIEFVRVDLPGRPVIPGKAEYVASTLRATTLSCRGADVFTVEHILAALFIAEIDNCQVELDGPEPPAADGSAAPFVWLIEEAGRAQQAAERTIARIDRPLAVYDGGRYLLATPYEGQRFSFLSLSDHPLLGAQYFDAQAGRTDFAGEIAPARTIAFTHEIEGLKEMGLGLGGSQDNVIVYDGEKPLTPLRFADELVRHKLLDLMGDLFLAGRFYGHITAVKSGHALNTKLALQIARHWRQAQDCPL